MTFRSQKSAAPPQIESPVSFTLISYVLDGNHSSLAHKVQVFASDGINERYIPRELCSNSNEKVIHVDDVYFFSNQSLSTVYVILINLHELKSLCFDPFANRYTDHSSVRLSSWRDCVRLSIDYNEGCHDKSDMVVYLNEIAKIMLVLTD